MARKALTDTEILPLVQSRVALSVGYQDSKLSKERENVTRYYDKEYPRPAHSGSSKYVSSDVYDSVESMKATLLETFSGNMKPVQFAPQDANDVEMARIATEFCSYVFFRQNNGFGIVQDVIHDGLTARAGVVKVFWETSEKEVEDTFTDASEEEVIALMDDETAELGDDLAPGPAGFSGTLKRKLNTSQVRLEVMAPEEFGISPRARSIEEAAVVYHRTPKTDSELIAAGYDRETVKALASDKDAWTDGGAEVAARFSGTDDGTGLNPGDDTEGTRRIMVYEVYTEIDLDRTGRARLWKITYAGNTILDREPVDRKPFVAFVPLPRSHAFWGSNFAAGVIPTQNARTVLMRGILDHTVITNNPRYQVVRGGLVNPKELMENRVGGLVNVTRPDAVMPLPQSGLNPFVFQTIQLLDEDKEESTGISKLSQGLNKDAISKQNSADMIGQLVSISQQRQKVIARNFAENFLRPLFLEIYRLVLENQDQQTVMEVAGNWVPVDPTAWVERKDCSVEFAIGYGEQEKEAQKFLQVDQYLSADPRLAPLYPLEKRANTIRRTMEAMGIKDVANFMLSPDQVQPAQPDPMQMLQLQTMQKQLEIAERQQALAERKFEFEQKTKTNAEALKATKVANEQHIKEEGLAIDRAETEHKMSMDIQEMQVLKTAPEVRGIASV